MRGREKDSPLFWPWVGSRSGNVLVLWRRFIAASPTLSNIIDSTSAVRSSGPSRPFVDTFGFLFKGSSLSSSCMAWNLSCGLSRANASVDDDLMLLRGKNRRGVTLKLVGGGREGLPGSEWDMLPPSWGRNCGRLNCAALGGPEDSTKEDSLSLNVSSPLMAIAWWVGDGGALLQ